MFVAHAKQYGEVPDEKITEVLSARGVDMLKYNIRDGAGQSLAGKPINHRRVLLISNPAFRAAEFAKSQAKVESERAVQEKQVADAAAKEERKKAAAEAAQKKVHTLQDAEVCLCNVVFVYVVLVLNMHVPRPPRPPSRQPNAKCVYVPTWNVRLHATWMQRMIGRVAVSARRPGSCGFVPRQSVPQCSNSMNVIVRPVRLNCM